MSLQQQPIIREVKQDDDFEQIRNLLLEKERANSLSKEPIKVASSETLKNAFFSINPACVYPVKRYVAVQEAEIVGFIGIELRGKDGLIFNFGVKHNDVQLLSTLVDHCADVITERGGQNLSYFAHTEFGQIRNEEISLLERLGFRTYDQYLRVSTSRSLKDWDAPEHIDTENIKAENMELDEIYKLILADNYNPNAFIFRHQFRAAEPSNVILTLRDEREQLTAIAYYKVKKVNPNRESVSATAFNVHFIPQFELTRNEKRRFLQTVLHSMKQLELDSVHSLMSLKNVDTFTLLIQEGFEQIQSHYFALTKTVGEHK